MRSRKSFLVGTAVLLALLLVASTVLLRQTVFKPIAITAYFATATAIYPGDEVRVAGVKVGTIKAIDPQGTEAKLTLTVDRAVPIPEGVKAVIVAPNLVAARFVQLTPAYREGDGPTITDGAVIPKESTAIPVEWDEVKTQLNRLATELGPQGGVSGTAASRFIDSAASAMDGNGAKLRETIRQLSGAARVLSEGSGNIVEIIKGLQTFVSALRDSSQQIVVFENRLATLTSVIDDSRSSLDSALSELSVAIGDVQRFVAGSRTETSEAVTKLAGVTQSLVNQKDAVRNILHVTPNAIANTLFMVNPMTGSPTGSFAFVNLTNPVQAICGMIGGVENITAPETAKLCSQYLGPAMRLLNFNGFPIPINPYLSMSGDPKRLIYTEPKLMPGAGGLQDEPEPAPGISAYTGLNGDVPPPPGWGVPRSDRRGAYAPDGLPANPSGALIPGAPGPSPTTFDGMMIPAGPSAVPAPGAQPDAQPGPNSNEPLLPAEGTPPS